MDAGWIPKNAAKAVRPPKMTQSPTLPFEPEDFEKILAGCDSYSIKGIHRDGNRTRLKATILLMRYSGLRIRDAATLERSRIKKGEALSVHVENWYACLAAATAHGSQHAQASVERQRAVFVLVRQRRP
ncbi:MAG TPA: hypothetical protein VIT67_05655 [Povalibacter sp.]